MRSGAFLVLAALAALRFAHWGAAFTDDEAFMLKGYAAKPLVAIATSFEAPNNHIFLSILLHAVNELSPKELIASQGHPGPLQAVSILASIGALLLLRRLASTVSARVSLLATAALGLSYWHLLYSHQLRGYCLSAFLLLTAVWLLHEACLGARRGLLAVFPLAFAAFSYTVASNLYIAAGLALGMGVWLWTAPVARRERFEALAALAAGLALTGLLYAPVLSAMREAARQDASLGGMAARLLPAFTVLGASTAFRVYFLLFAGFGALLGLIRPRRDALLPFLSVAMILTPLVLSSAQAIVIPFARVFVPLLPFWALLFALGLDGAAEFAVKRLPGATPAIPYALAALVALPSLAEARRFIGWHAGLDARGLLADVARRTRNMDDFVLILPQDASDRVAGGLAWEHHAANAGLQPQLRAVIGQEVPYLLHKQYFVAGADEAEARAALARSRVDPWLARRMAALSRHGALSLYGLTMDDALLGEYQAAAKDHAAEPALRAQALTALAFVYLDTDRTELAAARLEEARKLAPEDQRVRYYLGLTRYLAFDDRRAAEEFAWTVASDTTNARAPFYYADCLAGLGRTEEARRWLAWYDDPTHGSYQATWIFSNRAKVAAAALGRAGLSYDERAALERAGVAWRASLRQKPTVEALLGLARAHIGLQDRAAAEKLLRSVLASGGDPQNRYALAKILFEKGAIPEAKTEVEAFLMAFPTHAEARALLRSIRRN